MVTSNLPFQPLGETFSDNVVVAAAMIARLVHHAEVVTLTGGSYRTRQRPELIAKENRASRDYPTAHSGQFSETPRGPNSGTDPLFEK